MRGSAGIFIIIGIVILVLVGVAFSMGLINFQKTPIAQPSPTPNTLSNNPKYKDVKDKYNLSEEQLQILSTVNQEDNN